ncbi:hypothetical protein PV04_10300 [Phialophora macrospora]|uniref:Uncharacterized protein n=1 Tax=Phialophora macrospora TaxID=1851006 RepID=A0A0D2FTT7_9EURO|nr:hypothetical protein PV04_10300 [Phialophora macrospora]
MIHESVASYIHSFEGFSGLSQPEMVMMPIHESKPYRRLSRSLNDLDLVVKRRNIVGHSSHYRSCSEFSFDSSWFPARPHEPARPPPVRIPTPPGLPPFGSWEATLLRLEQRLLGRTSLTLRRWIHSHDESYEQDVASATANLMAAHEVSPVYSPPFPPQRPHDRRDLFRRTLAAIGMSRVFEPDTVHGRASSLSLPQISPQEQALSSGFQIVLPPWVYIANDPGPLARADDGTYIRGAFGPRFSGHGVGERTIEDLPLARVEKADAEPAAEIPATLGSLRRTDATSARGGVVAIGSAVEEEEEEGEYDERWFVHDEHS